MMYAEYLTTFDILMENINELINEFEYIVMTETGEAIEGEVVSSKEVKESVLKKIWNGIVKAATAICDWVRKKIQELTIYISKKFNKVIGASVLTTDITIHVDAVEGIPSKIMNTFKTAIFNLKSNIFLNEKDIDKLKEKLTIVEEYVPVKQQYPKGFKFYIKAVMLNMHRLDKIAENVKKSILDIDKRFTEKIEKTKPEMAKKYFSEIKGFLTRYKTYLTNIVNDMDIIIKNSEPIDNEKRISY